MQILERVAKCEMQRDMDVIRDLLLWIEQDETLDGTKWVTPDQSDFPAMGVPNHSENEVAYHLTLLIEADFVIGKTTMDMPIIARLTWKGHEFLANIKNDDVWTNTKKRLSGLTGVALSVVAAIAESEIKKRLSLP